MTPDQVRILAQMTFGGDVKVATGTFAVAVQESGKKRQSVIVGPCVGDDLTDSEAGCEGIVATVIVIPHRHVKLPPGTSWDAFLAHPTSYFKEDP